MKSVSQRLCIAIVMCLLMSVAALAKVKTQTIAFGQDFTIGGKLVKRGTYRVSFDDQTNELAFVDKKTKAVVAKVAARSEARTDDAQGTDISIVKAGDAQVFNSIAFHGDNRRISVGESNAGSTTTTVVNQ